jgi:hypothetical protein
MSFSCIARKPGNFTPEYMQYTAICGPTAVTIPAANPGDIFLDTLNNQIWYFGRGWTLWTSFLIDHRHPTMMERFLNPTETMFVWAHESTFYNAKKEFTRTFGKNFDPALIVNKYRSQQLPSPVIATLLALALLNSDCLRLSPLTLL